MRTRSRRPGFTLLELITACAGLIVILGVIVSLARYVRRNASLAAVREQLIVLNARLAEKGLPPGMEMFAANLTAADEQNAPESIHILARQNAGEWARHLGVESNACFDPWGMPIVLINGAHPALGMAPRFGPFFMSAGPDNRYFTLADDIYGYDIEPDRRFAATRPAGPNPPTRGGHPE